MLFHILASLLRNASHHLLVWQNAIPSLEQAENWIYLSEIP